MSQQDRGKLLVTSLDVSTCFSEEEWKLLQDWQKELYSNVMNEIHQALISLGPLIATTVVSLRAKGKEDKRPVDSDKWSTANDSCEAKPFGIKGEGNLCIKHPFNAERRGSNDHQNTGQAGQHTVAASTFAKNNKCKDTYICDLGEFERKMDSTIFSSESYPAVQPEILLRIQEEEELQHRDWPGEQHNIGTHATKGFSQLDVDAGSRSEEEAKAFLLDPPCTKRHKRGTSPSSGFEVVSFILKEEDEACSVDHQRVKDRGGLNITTGAARPDLPRAVLRGQECAANQVSEIKGLNIPINSTEQQQKSTWERTCTYIEFDRSTSNLSESMNNRRIHPGEKPYTEYDNRFSKESRTRKLHGTPEVQRQSTSTENERCLGESINISQQPKAHPSVKVCICSQCGICFNQSINANANQQVTSSEEGNICSDCMKSFFLSANFYKDQEREMAERPHICSECGKRFKTSQILLRHKRIHTGEKPYVCNECGKSFRHSHTLVTHQRLHTGDKPHRCTTCGKNFRQIPHLMKHQRMHMRVQKLQC